MKTLYFKNLDTTIDSGELISIIGPNGCGKTVLLKMLCGKVKNDNVFIDEKNINLYDIGYKRNNIVCVFDDNIYKTSNVIDELRYYLKILCLTDSEIDNRINDFNQYFKLDGILHESFINLDIENRIFVKILSLLIIVPNIIGIDDLFTYLKKDMKIKIFNYIKEKNITLIGVTSNMEELSLYDKILVMNKGRKELFDLTFEVLKREDVFNELGLNLPFIYDINNLLKSYDLIDRNHLVYKELVNVLWK